MHPYTVAYVAAEGLLVVPLHFASADLSVVLAFAPGRAVLQVDEYRCRIGCVVSVSVESHTGGSGQFCLYIGFFEYNTVVAWCGKLIVLREFASISIPSTGTFAGSGHYKYIAQVHTSRTIEVGLCKAPNDGVVVDIFRAISPTEGSGYRACLNHTKGCCRTRESVAVVGSTDKWIHVLGVIRLDGIGLCLVATAG